MARWILASDGQPFRDRDAAAIKRDLLLGELGSSVELDVIDHPAGGFAVCVGARGLPADTRDETRLASPRDAMIESLCRAPSASRPPERNTHETSPVRPQGSQGISARERVHSTSSERYPEKFRLNPAARAFLGLHLQSLLGAALLLQPHRVWGITQLEVPADVTLAAILLFALSGSGTVLLLLSLSRFLWAYSANTYLIDAASVEQIQWYFERGRLRRRAPRIRFAHLRTVDVDQTILQMLLNIGTVKLAAGATDTYEVVLRFVSAPRALQREFQQRLEGAGVAGGSLVAQVDV